MKTLKTLVLKTATVTGVKLVTPADRIGLGFGVAYPTDTLSPGHNFPLPQNPEPEQARVRQELSEPPARMRPAAGGDAVPPAGRPGCSPGSTAVRFASSVPDSLTSWRPATRTAAEGRADAACPTADPGRDHLPRDRRHEDRTGSDCQSPGRFGGKRWPATRVVSPAAAAGK